MLKTLGVYGAAGVVIIQLASSAFPYLYLPPWTVTFVIVLVVLGFPITFFLSWTYDLKRDNVKDDQSANTDVKTVKKWSLTKKIILPFTGFILMLIGGIFWFIYPFLTISLGDDREYDASIAILYMHNISSDEQSYFADGLTEEIISRVSRIQNLRVIPRIDVKKYKSSDLGSREISKELNVGYILEGTVRKNNNH